jgi:hypothetical protein
MSKESKDDDSVKRTMAHIGGSVRAAHMMGLMAALVGPGNMGLDAPVREQRKFDDDPKWNGPEKLSPSEWFISIGPGALEGKYYPCLMRPRSEVTENDRVLVDDPAESCVVMARMKTGFDTAEEAREFASRSMTSVAVLGTDGEFTYPHWRPPIIRKPTRGEIQAEERRQRRAAKLQNNWDRQNGSNTHG